MPEPTTYAGYKVGTLVALMLGAGVTSAITPGPWHLRLLAGASGAATAFVATPVFAPVMIRIFETIYGWAGLSADVLPEEGVVGITGFFLALIGIDLCRWLVDASKKMLARIPLGWPRKS